MQRTSEKPLRVLVAGRQSKDLQAIEAILREAPDIRSAMNRMAGTDDPLADLDALPEALVLVLEKDWRAPLQVLGELPPAARPPTLVIGPGGDLEILRLAMRGGACDYLIAPVQPGDLLPALERIGREIKARDSANDGRLTVVVNAKGGSGASFIACNLAHILASHFKARAALVDLDLQFGVLPLYFDMQANDGLIRAIESVETLDEMAVEGWMLKHGSGTHLLGNSHNQLVLPGEIPEERVAALLALLKRAYAQVLVDLPRQVDAIFAATVGQADQVVVVLQRNLASLRHARALMGILRGRYGLVSSQLLFLVNRWDDTGALTLKEIGHALDGSQVATLPSDHRRISQSLDVGTPLLDTEPKAAITKELLGLCARVSGLEPEKKGLFGRWLNR